MFWKRKKCGDPALSLSLSCGAKAFERVYQVNNEDMFAFRRVLLCSRSFLQQMENASTLLLSLRGPEKMKFAKLYTVPRAAAKISSRTRFKASIYRESASTVKKFTDALTCGKTRVLFAILAQLLSFLLAKFERQFEALSI
jgi:hypothetical protein